MFPAQVVLQMRPDDFRGLLLPLTVRGEKALCLLPYLFGPPREE